MRSSTTFFLVLLAFCEICGAKRRVETRLHARWRQTSILSEISEYLAKDDESNFWKFLESAQSRGGRTNRSVRDEYELGMSIAEELVDPSEIGLLRLAVSSRAMSPRVEAHRQLAAPSRTERCPSSFFVFRNQSGCHLSELNLDGENGNEQEIFEFDHVYPTGSIAPKVLVIYGSVGSDRSKTLMHGAKRLTESEKDLRFVFRHSEPSTSSDSLVSLSGYGVELALKNTEYKAVDAKKNDEIQEDLHGLNFKILGEKYKKHEKELESLRENLEKLGEIAPLKQWQIHDLGFRACQKMVNEKDLDSIEGLLQDFPVHARAISHVEVDDSIRKSVKKQQSKMNEKGIENGENVLAMNGRMVSKGESRLDLFSLIAITKQETRAVQGMAEIGFHPDVDFSQIVSVPDLSPIDSSVNAFDYRDTLPVYLNDLESKWGQYRSLDLLLQPFPPGQIRPISRNIFTVVLFSDPFGSIDEIFQSINEYLEADVYIRFGLVPIFDEKKHGMSIQEAVEHKRVSKGKRHLWPKKESLLHAIRRGNQFRQRTGLRTSPLVLLNGYPLDLSEGFESSLSEAIQVQTRRLQLSIFSGTVQNSVKISDWWLEKKTNGDIVDRVNQKVINSFNHKKFVDFDKHHLEFVETLHYFSSKSDTASPNSKVTTWIIADFGSSESRKLAAEALKSNAVEGSSKVALISNPEDIEHSCSWDFGEIGSVQRMLGVLKNKTLSKETRTFCSSQRNHKIIFSLTGLAPGETAVVSNGLIIGPLSGEDLLTSEDFAYLQSVWKKRGVDNVANLLNEQIAKDVSVQFYSHLGRVRENEEVRMDFSQFKDPNDKNVLIFPPLEPESPAVSITWIANPVSREAQQIVSIIRLLRNCVNARVEVIFNPNEALTEMPLRRFYRFVASNELSFNPNGSILSHAADFSDLPQKQLLTMSVHTNDAWMVELKQAEYDLDNILLESASGDVRGEFSLDHILVEGQAAKPSGEAAEGLELELEAGEKVYDTIVMLNLGYFQLKAEPGVWTLKLRDGESAQMHRMTDVDSKKTEQPIRVLVDSFTGKWTKIVVVRREKHKKSQPSTLANLMETAKKFFSPSPETHKEVNVFSLASGHLYERFMRIMIVSVMKQTKTEKVKFWLLKNYLSPKFKETIPILAKRYGFSFEFVEYKWPKWLHQQTEKQRIMWGYKILFLDVLFPLNVDKIIFVDADQVVRADLQELMDYDLKGAPYGYAPFCDSRKEMDGFRFWQSGYWKNHLMSRRYHISALYVVDLKNFRLLSAGDRLRARYSVLSADSQSLSNLDQDLPNNMIHEVPIRTLPQDWLWCETWCDDESKKTAKTIDLCNNPLTKEPKLDSAQRIIGEWKELDDEISTVLSAKDRSGREVKVEL